MAEKNTLSILETIKKKMQKLDTKAPEKIPDATNATDDEFQYISSKSSPEEKKEIKANTSLAPKFEDDLGLGDIVSSTKQPEIVKAEAGNSFNDFNVDELDLDNEEKSFNAPANPPVVNSQPQSNDDKSGENISEDDIEDSEETADFDEGEAKKEDVMEDESSNLDWLKDDTNSPEMTAKKVEGDDLDLDLLDEGDEQKEVKQQDQDIKTSLAPESFDLEDDLSLESKDEDSLDLENHEVESDNKSKGSEDLDLDFEEDGDDEEDENEDEDHHEEDSKEDDLDFLDEDEDDDADHEVVLPEETKDLKKEEDHKDDDLSFDDFENEEEPNVVAPSVEQTKFEQVQATTYFPEGNSPSDSNVVEDKHEIDIEFEKEIMGLRPGFSDASNQEFKLEEREMKQPINQAPIQQGVAVFNESKALEIKTSEPAFIRQVGDSMKKLIDAKNVVSGISSFSQSPALSELAIALMEPKLEKWFEANLPDLVEKVVREEIKKMIPKE